MANVICLGGGLEGLPILQRVKALGHRLVVVDGNAHALGFALADYTVLASCYDVAQTLEGLMRDDRLYPVRPDAVLCCAIDAPQVAAAVAAHYGLPGLGVEAAAVSADKVAQKTALHLAGLPVPDFAKFDLADIHDCRRGLEMLMFGWNGRAVIKPVDSRGARGVVLATEDTDLAAALAGAARLSPTGRVAAEEYIPGSQLSTESIVQDGRVLFTMIGTRNYAEFQRGDFGPHPVENGFDAPTPTFPVWFGDQTVWQPLAQAIDVLLASACKALGWTGGLTVKGDWIIDGTYGKLYILELAARLSGGFFGSHGAPLAYGVDLVGAAVRLALGERVETPAVTTGQFVCQRYVFPDAGDVGRRVARVPDTIKADGSHWLPWQAEAISRNPWAVALDAEYATYAIHAGDPIRPVTDHGARWGQVICTGATPEEARARAEAAVAKMKAVVVLE